MSCLNISDSNLNMVDSTNMIYNKVIWPHVSQTCLWFPHIPITQRNKGQVHKQYLNGYNNKPPPHIPVNFLNFTNLHYQAKYILWKCVKMHEDTLKVLYYPTLSWQLDPYSYQYLLHQHAQTEYGISVLALSQFQTI